MGSLSNFLYMFDLFLFRMANMPPYALKACQKEMKRLKKMPNAMPEYALTRNYLELMADLPWSKQTKDVLDIAQAR